MKSLFAAAAVLLAGSLGNASICDKSWSEVEASRYSAEFPKIQFGTTFVSVDGVCVEGKKLFTTSKIEICKEQATGEASGCVKAVKKYLRTNVAFMHEIQVGEGSEFRAIPSRHALTYQIPVGTDGEAFHAVCMKSFTIPNCGSSK